MLWLICRIVLPVRFARGRLEITRAIRALERLVSLTTHVNGEIMTRMMTRHSAQSSANVMVGFLAPDTLPTDPPVRKPSPGTSGNSIPVHG